MPTTTFRYVVIRVDGTAAVEECDVDGIDDIAAVITEAVGGLLAIIPTDYPTLGIWYNQEGLPLQLPPNRTASRAVFVLGGPAQILHGPVVITGQSGDETHTLTDDQVDMMLGLAVLAALD
jgi:hypothetical protein